MVSFKAVYFFAGFCLLSFAVDAGSLESNFSTEIGMAFNESNFSTEIWSDFDESYYCNFSDIEVLRKCYRRQAVKVKEQYNIKNITDYLSKFAKTASTWKGIEEICMVFGEFEECLGPKIIENCVNYYDFEVDPRIEASQFMAVHFLQINYFCGKGFETFKNNFKCITSKLNLHTNDIECSLLPEIFEANVTSAENKCGKESACFARTFRILETCIRFCNCSETVPFTKQYVDGFCDNLVIEDASNAVNIGYPSIVVLILAFLTTLFF